MPIVDENDVWRKQRIIQILIQKARDPRAERLVDLEEVLFPEGDEMGEE